MKDLYTTLKERGFIYQMTNEEEVKKLVNGKTTIYLGIDPTADSLHIGHCFPLIMLKYFQEAGHKIIILIGGATAQIGDPTGKTDMRKMIGSDFINNNLEKIKNIIGKFLKVDGENAITFVNNADWYKDYSFVDFMQNIGVHFNVNKMLSSDAYTKRLEQGGLTFLEMSYMLMQAYDFVYLNRNYDCRLEVGGSDQWGNILAGADLGRKLNNLENKDEEAFQGLTCNLLTNAEGVKMGKTEKGAIWVDKEKTSVFDFYQYFYNVKDEDTKKLLTYFSRMPISEIDELVTKDIRLAKRTMAYEVTKLVHGKDEADKVLLAVTNLFGDKTNLTDVPFVEINESQLPLNIIDALTLTKLVISKSEGRRMVEQGAVSLNNEVIKSFDYLLKEKDFQNNEVLLKRGKKNYFKIILKK